MTQEQVTAVAGDFEERYAAAFNRRDVGTLVELFAEDTTVVT